MSLNNLKKQIVFSDYDGTIYITNENMPQNIKAIEEYRKLGGMFVIITGRSKISINKMIEKYNIPFDYIISNNGAAIFDKASKKIYEQVITKNISDEIIEYLKHKENIEIFFYDDEDKVSYHGQNLLKIRVKTRDYKLAQSIENEINSKFKDCVKAFLTIPSMYYANDDFALVDVVFKSAGKEDAIKKLLEILNIDKEQVVTIGDGRNDVAMIKEYNGYSMETAENIAKQSASKIFKSIKDMLEYLKR